MTSPVFAAPTAAFAALDERVFRASELTRGPWHPEHQHAGPPTALVARAIERAAQSHGLTHLARLTANLVRPVPIGDLAVEVMTDYAGRNAAHFSAHLMAGPKEVGRFTALVQREQDFVVPEGTPGHPLPRLSPQPDLCPPTMFPFAARHLGYPELVETRLAQGRMFDGPSAVWFRLRHPLVEGATTSPYQAVAVAADSGNGISAVLDYRKVSFVNADLTINLLRRPRGDWVGLESRTWLGDTGGGLAESALYDVHGLIGRATQSLAVRAR